jgi:hypothetical protein
MIDRGVGNRFRHSGAVAVEVGSRLDRAMEDIVAQEKLCFE